jgi:hypothetical protein
VRPSFIFTQEVHRPQLSHTNKNSMVRRSKLCSSSSCSYALSLPPLFNLASLSSAFRLKIISFISSISISSGSLRSISIKAVHSIPGVALDYLCIKLLLFVACELEPFGILSLKYNVSQSINNILIV